MSTILLQLLCRKLVVKTNEMIFDEALDVLVAELIICGLKAVAEMNLVMSRLVFSTWNLEPSVWGRSPKGVAPNRST